MYNTLILFLVALPIMILREEFLFTLERETYYFTRMCGYDLPMDRSRSTDTVDRRCQDHLIY